jgi:hypothetical protein
LQTNLLGDGQGGVASDVCCLAKSPLALIWHL